MKLTKSQLKQIIKEEITNLLEGNKMRIPKTYPSVSRGIGSTPTKIKLSPAQKKEAEELAVKIPEKTLETIMNVVLGQTVDEAGKPGLESGEDYFDWGPPGRDLAFSAGGLAALYSGDHLGKLAASIANNPEAMEALASAGVAAGVVGAGAAALAILSKWFQMAESLESTGKSRVKERKQMRINKTK